MKMVILQALTLDLMSACLWAEMMVNLTQSLLGIDLETAKAYYSVRLNTHHKDQGIAHLLLLHYMGHQLMSFACKLHVKEHQARYILAICRCCFLFSRFRYSRNVQRSQRTVLQKLQENQLVCMLVDTMARGMGVRCDLVPRMGLLLEIRCILLQKMSKSMSRLNYRH